ncbi:MAG: PKD domain-containing protein [Chloroflexota bacterium]
MRRVGYAAFSCLMCVLLSLIGTAAANACTLDNVASAAANGQRAVLSSSEPQAGKPWAPFRFAQAYSVGTSVTLSENRADIAKSLPASMLATPFRWVLGDGSSSRGMSVTHGYKQAGTYFVQVYAYASSEARWVLFDTVLLQIVPSNQLWQANLGYHALQVVDFATAWFGKLLTAVLAVLLMVTVVGHFRRRAAVTRDGPGI